MSFQAVQCSHLDVPADGAITPNSVTFNYSITYTFDVGYLVGNDSIRYTSLLNEISGMQNGLVSEHSHACH